MVGIVVSAVCVVGELQTVFVENFKEFIVAQCLIALLDIAVFVVEPDGEWRSGIGRAFVRKASGFAAPAFYPLFDFVVIAGSGRHVLSLIG